MEIDYVSDLHVNHYVGHHNNLVKNELKTKKWAEELFQTKSKYSHALIIAGDFSEWNRQSLWILEEARQHYQKVFFCNREP